jgi:hypothetical protein
VFFHNLTIPKDTKTLTIYVQYHDLEPLLKDMLPKKAPLIVGIHYSPSLNFLYEGCLHDAEAQLGFWSWISDFYLPKEA